MHQIQRVVIDGSVALKIIKHCQEEVSSGSYNATGTLYGLAKSKSGVLEITHCLPTPPLPSEDSSNTNNNNNDANVNSEQYLSQFETDMIKHMRQVNIDYLNVGFYQSAYGGTFVNRALIEGLFLYQTIISESIILVHDPTKVANGHISIKAYRMTQDFLNVFKTAMKEEEKNMREAFKKVQVEASNLLEEVELHIKTSHLSSLLLHGMEKQLNKSSPTLHYSGLNLSMGQSLERTLKNVLACVEDQCTEVNKHNQYHRVMSKHHDRQIDRLPQPPPRLDSALLAAQVSTYTDDLDGLIDQWLTKLSVAKSIQEGKTH